VEGNMRNGVDKLIDPFFELFRRHDIIDFSIILLWFFFFFFFFFFSLFLFSRLRSWGIFSRSFCSRSSFGWGFSFLLFCFRLSFRDGLILSFTFFNFCFLLIFLSFSRFRNDGLSFSIKFEHVWFLSKTLGNLINSSVDHIDEAFK